MRLIVVKLAGPFSVAPRDDYLGFVRHIDISTAESTAEPGRAD